MAPVEVQREIVTAVPEILDDAQHNEAATELKLATFIMGWGKIYWFKNVG